jgi:hypothetical protein
MTGRRALLCHPSCSSNAACRVACEPAIEGGALHLRYVLEGDLARIRIPQRRAPRAADDLWRHTCFEAFVGNADGRYHEFNFAPSGEWAAYAFSAYRERAPVVIEVDPRIEVQVEAHALALSAQVPAAALPGNAGAPWRIALSAVVEGADGALSYWALHHPARRPDFHHAESFVLEIAAAR